MFPLSTGSKSVTFLLAVCDLILNSRQKYLKHLESHSSTIPCDVCPIDTVVEKLINFFTRKSSQNLE